MNAPWCSSIVFLVVIIPFLVMDALHKIRSLLAQPISYYWWKAILGIGSIVALALLIYYMLVHPQPLVYGDARTYLGAAMAVRSGESCMLYNRPITIPFFLPCSPPCISRGGPLLQQSR